MMYLLFALSVLGLGLLVVCIIMLVAPFTGWRCIYDAAVTQMTVDIPKAGRYSINISRDRFWLLKGHGTITDAFPYVNFSIQRPATGETIQYVPRRSLMTSTGTRRISVPVGYFDALDSGTYLIISLPDSRFLQNDRVLVRRHMSFAKLFLLIWGIVIGGLMFTLGLMFGIMTAVGGFVSVF